MQRYANIHYFWQPENDKIKTDMENTGYREIDIMGIINVTDNSFYGNSRYLGKDGRPDTGRLISGHVRHIPERMFRMKGKSGEGWNRPWRPYAGNFPISGCPSTLSGPALSGKRQRLSVPGN